MIEALRQYDIFDEEVLLSLHLLPSQGYCNTNYKLKSDKRTYLVRKFRLADRDRAAEFRVQQKAFQYKIGAKPLLLDQEAGIMISLFLPGSHKEKLQRKEIRLLARALRKLHRIPFGGKAMQLPRKLRHKIYPFNKELVLCHNDVSVKNILFTRGIKLIDWEYAGLGERYFDLASACEEFGFDRAAERYFLYCYGEKINDAKLQVYKEIYAILYKEWFEKLEKGELTFHPHDEACTVSRR